MNSMILLIIGARIVADEPKEEESMLSEEIFKIASDKSFTLAVSIGGKVLSGNWKSSKHPSSTLSSHMLSSGMT